MDEYVWPADNPSNLTGTIADPNATNSLGTLPPPQQHVLAVVCVYAALFGMAAVGNLTVFVSLFRSRHRKSRISLMIRHLAIADLIVTFIMIPIEVGWRLTDRWVAGNVACKVVLFLRAFGPYLSSNVLICVSLDRYFAVLHPLRVNDARRRGKMMLACAWGASFCYCIPQAFVFSVQQHPNIPKYFQCVSFGYFTNEGEVAYNLVCVMELYFIPLAVILVAYTCILREISKNSKTTEGETTRTSNGRLRLRRSDISNIERARARTLRMTIMIVAVYIWCCTPYVVITCWYMFDKDTVAQLPDWLQDVIFMMVVSNSCMNPLVYGSFVLHSKYTNCLQRLKCWRGSSTQNLHNGDMAPSAGHHKLARRVIKCFLGFRKVNSTRSTATVQQANAVSSAVCRTPVNKSAPRDLKGFLPGIQLPSPDVPSAGRVSFHSEPGPGGPAPTPDDPAPAASRSSGELRGHVSVSVGDAEVRYGRDTARTRNV